MKKNYFKEILSLFFFFVQISSFSQPENALLWEISGKDLKEPSYLYGTIHFICKDLAVISPEFKNVIQKVDKVYLEINFDEDINDFKNHFDKFNRNGKKLHEYFTKEEYGILDKKFNQKFGRFQISLGQFSNYKPNEILRSLSPRMSSCTRFTSYEAEIASIASKKNIKIAGLENFEEHNSFVEEDDSTIAKNAKIFYEIITKKETADEIFDEQRKIANIYLKKDINTLHEISQKEMSKDEFERVLNFRNRLWIPRIAQFSSQNQVLYAVGAGHLAGENGVINLLRKEGFTVTPLFY